MWKVLKSDTATFLKQSSQFPLISWHLADWEQVLPVCWLTLKYQLFMSHRALNVTCHKFSKCWTKRRRSGFPRPPSAQLAVGWLTADWGGDECWLPGSQLVRLSLHPPPSPNYFHTFPQRSLWFPYNSYLSGPSPFLTSCFSVCHSLLRPNLCPMPLPIIVWASFMTSVWKQGDKHLLQQKRHKTCSLQKNRENLYKDQSAASILALMIIITPAMDWPRFERYLERVNQWKLFGKFFDWINQHFTSVTYWTKQSDRKMLMTQLLKWEVHVAWNGCNSW